MSRSEAWAAQEVAGVRGEFLAGCCCDEGSGAALKAAVRSTGGARPPGGAPGPRRSAGPPRPPSGGQGQPRGVQSEEGLPATVGDGGRGRRSTSAGSVRAQAPQMRPGLDGPAIRGCPARKGAHLGQMPSSGYFHVPLTPHPRIPGSRRAGAASAEGSSI